VDPSGNGDGGLTATGRFCGSCGAQSSPTAKFCGECGARLTQATQSAEYKQVTVLFADVVHSMGIAAAVGAERLREIMAELVNRAAVVVQRYGAEAVRIAEVGGDDVALELSQIAHGLVLSRRATAAERGGALEVLRRARDSLTGRRNLLIATMADIRIVELTAEAGEVQGAIERARSIVDRLFENGEMFLRGSATSALVEPLLSRGSDTDVQEAAAAIDRLAAVPTDPGFVLNEIPLLRMRALLARAHGDEAAYRDYRNRYRALATELGFEGHMAMAEAMP
jgi:hypothetical protein